MAEKKFLISLKDPHIFDASISPLFELDKEIKGFEAVDFWKSMQFGRAATSQALQEDPKMKQAELNFIRFCKEVEESKCSFDTPPEKFSIPPIIHFIWLGSETPKELISALETWRWKNPGWEIKVWSEPDVNGFNWSNGYTKWLYLDAKTWGEKSDILRYEILYQFGGIYTDFDIICFKSFNDLIAHDNTFFGCLETNNPNDSDGKTIYLSNSIFGAAKHSPVMKFCLDHLISQDEAPGKSLMVRTGPFLLSKAVENAMESKEKILTLPCSYFFPLPHFSDLSHKNLTAKEIKDNFIAKESFVVHLWAASWYL